MKIPNNNWQYKIQMEIQYYRLHVAYKIAQFQQIIGCHQRLYNWFIPPFFGSLLWWLNRIIDPTSDDNPEELNWTTLEAIRVKWRMDEDTFWKMFED
jgi:hypothetical protein